MCKSFSVELKSTPSELLTLNGEITNESSRKAKMKVKFPAMEATIGQRTYYACVMKLAVIPKMFTFTDWSEFTAEDREQRVLNKNRIPDIARYILDNEDGYLFSSITASYKCSVRFEPLNADGLGFLEMDFQEANFVINDGQHRCAAIHHALKENPAIGEESISVLLFPYENKARVQQMFADLNRYVVKTNNPTNILVDHRDTLGRVTLEMCEKVPAFQGLVDKEHQSLPARSEKMFTLYALYDATKELLADKSHTADGGFDELVAGAVDYWVTVSQFMPDWLKVRNREMRPIELRQENISTHSVVLRALGGVGAELSNHHPSDWKDRLAGLTAINWNKRNRDWENVCMVANSVVANRQARQATKAYVKRKLGLATSESETKSIDHLTMQDGSAKSFPNGLASESHAFHPQPKRPSTHPAEVRIASEAIRIRKWNQVPIAVANWVLRQGKSLPVLQNFVHRNNIGFANSANTKELKNGWYIEVGDSQETLLLKGRRLLDSSGFRHIFNRYILDARACFRSMF
ncbi:MAG: DNA sulfur modification protein DndB [Verrucomicrobia bacterium]|nr:DNA sulfur modification protein DndB [Verrucomicrobiota bacterium]